MGWRRQSTTTTEVTTAGSCSPRRRQVIAVRWRFVHRRHVSNGLCGRATPRRRCSRSAAPRLLRPSYSMGAFVAASPTSLAIATLASRGLHQGRAPWGAVTVADGHCCSGAGQPAWCSPMGSPLRAAWPPWWAPQRAALLAGAAAGSSEGLALPFPCSPLVPNLRQLGRCCQGLRALGVVRISLSPTATPPSRPYTPLPSHPSTLPSPPKVVLLPIPSP
ncbi:hypothetical protein SETIT_3G306700v2 [Setaria italica]|uniref:Uncharacterized protein n=1 Tax=Setaria italica TaxID=4555 RepID=A0A368QML4_SETIT|nr:hypothetical protein SETIT_3G306700v2 [Setaria italica]